MSFYIPADYLPIHLFVTYAETVVTYVNEALTQRSEALHVSSDRHVFKVTVFILGVFKIYSAQMHVYETKVST